MPQGAAERKTVLVVDDDQTMVALLRDIVSREFEVVTAPDGPTALDLLRAKPVAAIMMDQRLPGMSGTEVLARAIELAPHATRIMVTASERLEDARDAVNLGKVDRYVTKPVRPTELMAILRGAIRESILAGENARLVAELKEANQRLSVALAEVRDHEAKLEDEVVKRTRELRTAVAQLEQLALRDGLTGLYNHRYFQESLNAEIARAIRHQRRLALAFIDVDHFKNYNDRNGHPKGDDLLRELARILSHTGGAEDIKIKGRLSDIACRYGGEEFVIILPESDKVGARVRAERVRSQVADYPFPGREAQPGGTVSVSIGISSFPDDAKTKQELIQAADEAMLKAKRSGRNRVVLA